jgi:protein arginine kinase activator
LSEKAGPIDAPAQPAATPPALAGGRGPSPEVCPVCGMNWNEFKQAGVMGCGHDYEQFAGKLLPLLKRAQEGAADHVGKVPARKKTPDADRQVTTLRLRRELQKALETENYEAAAQLRDKLRTLERN